MFHVLKIIKKINIKATLSNNYIIDYCNKNEITDENLTSSKSSENLTIPWVLVPLKSPNFFGKSCLEPK